MWGIDPCTGARSKRAHWEPRAHRSSHRPVLSKSVGVPIRARICAVFIREAASGAHLSDSLAGLSSDLEEARARAIGPPFSCVRCFWPFDRGSLRLRILKTCHTPSSCSAHLGVGDDGSWLLWAHCFDRAWTISPAYG